MVFHLPRGKRKIAVIAGVIGNIMEMVRLRPVRLHGLRDLQALLSGRKPVRIASRHVRHLCSGFHHAAFGFGRVRLARRYDRERSRTMLISVALMTFPTFLLGVLPTYSAIGVWAPVCLVLIRLTQGLSVGGEFSSSVT